MHYILALRSTWKIASFTSKLMVTVNKLIIINLLHDGVLDDGQIAPDREAACILQSGLLDKLDSAPTTLDTVRLEGLCYAHRFRISEHLAVSPQRAQSELGLHARRLCPSYEMQERCRVARSPAVAVGVESDVPVAAAGAERRRAHKLVDADGAVEQRIVVHHEVVRRGGRRRHAPRRCLSRRRGRLAQTSGDVVPHGKRNTACGRAVFGISPRKRGRFVCVREIKDPLTG